MTIIACANCFGRGYVYTCGYDGMKRPITCKGCAAAPDNRRCAVPNLLYDEAAAVAQLSTVASRSLVDIGRLADQFKADKISALHFTVRVGVILSRIEAGDDD